VWGHRFYVFIGGPFLCLGGGGVGGGGGGVKPLYSLFSGAGCRVS
jgi:hypothetical protein